MYKIFARISFVIIISLSILSCKNDIDINADWKDIPVVYGLLDPTADTQYIKINRAFLGDGDALVMAQNPDSIHYNYKLEVSLEEWRNGSLKYIYPQLDTITLPNTKEGVFSSEKNTVYFCKTPLLNPNDDYTLNPESEYRIVIKNPVNGKIIESKTNIVKNFSLVKPIFSPTKPQISFYIANNYIPSLTFEWKSAANGIIHEAVMRFYYKEFHIGQNDTIQKHLDINIGQAIASSIDGGENLTVKFSPISFYQILERELVKDPAIGRRAGTFGSKFDQINLIISVAGEELSTYINIHKPSNSLIQEKPEYSNLSNAVGLFSSRYQKIKTGISLNLDSDYELKNGTYTKDLNFM